MINGPYNKEFLLNILKNADLAKLESMEYQEVSKLPGSLNPLLAHDPILMDSLVCEGLNTNSHHLTFILSVLAPNYFEKNLSKFKLSDFTASLQAGPFKGTSPLWCLAAAAREKQPEALMAVLSHFKGQLRAADFTASAQVGPHKGKSALWWLACPTASGKPEVLMAVLSQLKGQFRAADFTAIVQEGLFKDLGALQWLVCTAVAGKPEALMTVLAHVAFDRKTLTNLINNIISQGLPKEAEDLITAKIHLAALFESDSLDELALFSKAEAAKLVGYVEAYYELGRHFEKMNMPEQAVRAFLQMPDNSYYLDDICSKFSVRYIGIATEATNNLEKLSHLDTALKFALKIVNDEKRHATLQTIARIYINLALRGIDVGNAAIPAHLLEVMHGQLTSSWCFKVFQQLAETQQLNRDLQEKNAKTQQLKRDLQEKNLKLAKSKLKRALEQENFQQVLMPIKHLLSQFENEKRQSNEQAKRARSNEAEQVVCQDEQISRLQH